MPINMFLSSLTFVALLAQPLALDHKKKVEVRVVKYDELADTIRELKGKVVVVDFWAHW